MQQRVKHLLMDFHIPSFGEDLVYWFERHMRDLPWRQDKDPYKIWVSEIMLQQTRVDTVIPYFNKFMQKFPTLDHLANADEEDVLKQWEGLGYYSRARHLHQAVREVQESYGSKVPNDPQKISKLKGVGPYTAGAILSIAYGKQAPAVDGNVMRVLSRIFAVKDDIAKPNTRKLFEGLVRQLIPEQAASHFNQGLMELGALICKPSSPECLLCPVRGHCRSHKQGIEQELPVKTKKKKPKVNNMVVGVLVDKKRVLIRRRPDEGLLAKMYEFPNLPWKNRSPEKVISEHLFEKYGIKTCINAEYDHVRHVFTHLVWEMTVYELSHTHHHRDWQSLPAECTWVKISELDVYPFPVSHQKIKQQLMKRHDVTHA